MTYGKVILLAIVTSNWTNWTNQTKTFEKNWLRVWTDSYIYTWSPTYLEKSS